MKYMIVSVLVIVLVVVTGAAHFVSAHEGMTHTTEIASIEQSAKTDEQMRTLIALLQKLVFLLQMKLETENKVAVSQPVVLPPVHTIEPGELMDDHHEMHMPEPDVVVSTPPEKKLIIELEEHHDATHVHVRYIDAPEEMFFVEVPLSDENGVVRMTAERTGLSESAIRAALVYTGM